MDLFWDVPDSVNVEVIFAANSQGCLHRSLLRAAGADVGKPVRVDRVVGTGENPRNACTGVVRVHHAD